MTTSCTHSLELAVRMLDLKPEDEVILPSFTYPSTANAVLLAGGKVVFSQVDERCLLLDPTHLEEKITVNTRAIIPVHYGGNICDMKAIMALAAKHDLVVIEDAAQAFLSHENGQMAGSFGHFGCFSFHGTKDVSAGEGGALLINDPTYIERAEIFRDKGTNVHAFRQGKVLKYEWVGQGSSLGPSDMLMASLYGQIQMWDEILLKRKEILNVYEEHFEARTYECLENTWHRREANEPNGHLFYLLFKNVDTAAAYIAHMKKAKIDVRTHFVPLHTSQYGKTMVDADDSFIIEKDLGRRLVRLPIYPDLSGSDLECILFATDQFMKEVEQDGIHCHTNI